MAGLYNRTNIPEIETTVINKRYMDDLLLATQMVQFCTPADEQGMYKGDGVRWHHFKEWTEDVTVLSETSPTDNEITTSGLVESVNATLNPYGAYIEVADFSLKTAVMSTLEKIRKRAADAGARAIDQLAYAQAVSSSVIHYAGQTAVATSGAPTTSKAADFVYMAAYLNNQGANGFDHIGGMFGGVIHPTSAAHLKGEAQGTTSVPTWSDVNKHVVGAQEKILKGECGALFGVKLFESPLIDAVNGEDYDNVVLAKDGIGISSLDGEAKARVIIKSPGPGDTSQPLDTYQTVGWKWMGAVKLLDSNRVVRYWASQS